LTEEKIRVLRFLADWWCPKGAPVPPRFYFNPSHAHTSRVHPLPARRVESKSVGGITVGSFSKSHTHTPPRPSTLSLRAPIPPFGHHNKQENAVCVFSPPSRILESQHKDIRIYSLLVLLLFPEVRILNSLCTGTGSGGQCVCERETERQRESLCANL
jgi:hypothetical protein